jgi:hypothetical protein
MSLIDIYDSWRKRRNYEKAVKGSKDGSVWLHENIFSIKLEPLAKHFGHDERLAEYKQVIAKWNNTGKNINFGDSISDFSREQFATSHDGIFSIGGSWAQHMEMMIIDLHADLSKHNVKNITIGTLGGNPLLVYRNKDEVINLSLKCLNKLRELYPNSRIIVYGIPPLFNIYATNHCTEFDMKMIEWVINDKDARFLSLKEHFGSGWMRLFPTAKWSADGVHFNERGSAKLSQLLYNLMK